MTLRINDTAPNFIANTTQGKVIKLGAEYEEIATNQLDDGFDASMAIVGDEIYLRGRENLYCIAETGRD